jgi:hypothetical protein
MSVSRKIVCLVVEKGENVSLLALIEQHMPLGQLEG